MQSLQEREEQLEKKKELLQKRINDEMEKAREFTRQKKKSQALMCLKKKKMFEQQLERMDALISRVLEQRNMLEEQQTTIGVLGAMQDAAKAQKKTMQVGTCIKGCAWHVVGSRMRTPTITSCSRGPPFLPHLGHTHLPSGGCMMSLSCSSGLGFSPLSLTCRTLQLH